MTRIFISYSRKDKTIAEYIAKERQSTCFCFMGQNNQTMARLSYGD